MSEKPKRWPLRLAVVAAFVFLGMSVLSVWPARWLYVKGYISARSFLVYRPLLTAWESIAPDDWTVPKPLRELYWAEEIHREFGDSGQ